MFGWPFTFVIAASKMAGASKNSRRRAYQCPECQWRRERAWTVELYMKQHFHLIDAPHSCWVCKYNAGTFSQTAKHLKLAKHIKNMSKQSKTEEDVIQHTSAKECVGKFDALGAGETANFWQRKKDRQAQKMKENIRPREGQEDKSLKKDSSSQKKKTSGPLTVKRTRAWRKIYRCKRKRTSCHVKVKTTRARRKIKNKWWNQYRMPQKSYH